VGKVFKLSEVKRAIDGKVKPDMGKGSERTGWVVLDGVRVFLVTYPKGHGGDIAPGTANSIRNQLKLSWGQFRDLVACPLSGPQYYDLLRAKHTDDLI
jgi:hypothetical protein